MPFGHCDRQLAHGAGLSLPVGESHSGKLITLREDSLVMIPVS